MIVVLVLVLWNAVSALFSNPQTPPTPADSSTSSESVVVNGSAADCAPGTVQVDAVVGDSSGPKATFAEAEEPLIWYEITNTSLEECNFNAGARVTFFTISSGEDVIWTSRDCDRAGDQDLIITLPPNQPQQSQPSAWARVRSSETGCGVGQEAVPAGGASYHLSVEVNGEISKNTQQFLLN